MKVSILLVAVLALLFSLCAALQSPPFSNSTAISTTHSPKSHNHATDHHAIATAHHSFARLYNLTSRFWSAFVYPSNTLQATSINSTLFSPSIIGRVDASRTFAGAELNTEYVFSLFSTPPQGIPHFFTLLGLPQSFAITHFAAAGNVVSSAVVLYFDIPELGVKGVPVEIDAWFSFDKDGLITQYDATFRYWEWALATLLDGAQMALGLNSTAAVTAVMTDLISTSVCETASLFCNGTNTQYDDFDTCYGFLVQEVRFGAAYELGRDTLLCRMVHQVMVPLRPDVHCAHIGPTGGVYCVDDLTYAEVVTEAVFVDGFVPFGFQDGNETVAQM